MGGQACRRMRTAIVALSLVTLLLAGCASQHEEESFTLTVNDLPARTMAGGTISMMLNIQGSPEVTSDHIGAHYWNFTTTDPTADFTAQAGACKHVEGSATAPGAFPVSCTFEKPGVYYVHGHMRTTHDGQIVNWWSKGHKVVVGMQTGANPTYTLTTSEVPSTVAAGTAFTYMLKIEGPAFESDHIGGHYWAQPTDNPDRDLADSQGCAHKALAVPAEVEVTCTISKAGQYQLRGHVRFTYNEEQYNFWAAPNNITVT
jgi:hypothetical protein